jgi:hypothetical protein
MMIMVFGPGNEPLKSFVKREYPSDLFHFVEEISTIDKDFIEQDLVINGNFSLYNYDAFILSSTASAYNYLWSECSSVPWFHNPFDLRCSTNHNFYFGIAEGTKFKIADSKPFFENNKVSVYRDFPKGKECSFLLLSNMVIPLSGVDLPKSLTRTCITFLRDLSVRFGTATFITNGVNLYLKEFSPIPNWETLSDKNIKLVIDKVLFTAKIRSTALKAGR